MEPTREKIKDFKPKGEYNSQISPSEKFTERKTKPLKSHFEKAIKPLTYGK